VVSQYLSEWWKGATVGRGNGKDIVNIPMDIEVKARSDFKPLEFLRQSEKRSKESGELSLVVCRMNGQGENAAEYLSFLRFSDLVQLLIQAGYTDMQSDMEQLDPMRCNMCGAWSFKETCNMCEKDPDANL